MTKILFVCHGNICRSPMAEFIMKDMVAKAGLENSFFIASAATSDEETGNPVYPGARNKLAQFGLSSDGKRARRLKREDYDEFDLLIGMDDGNIRGMLSTFGGDPESKIRKLKDFCGGGDIADPWYTDDFDTAYGDILEGCICLLGNFCFGPSK